MKSNVAAMNINLLPDEVLLKIFGYIKQNKLAKTIARYVKFIHDFLYSNIRILDIE